MQKAESVSAYIARAPKDVRPKLSQIRAAIKKVAPKAIEYISYGMPVYKYEKPFVGFSAMKNHIGLHPMSGSFVADHPQELAAYRTSKGAIQLPLDKALPISLIKRIVRQRIEEIEDKTRQLRSHMLK